MIEMLEMFKLEYTNSWIQSSNKLFWLQFLGHAGNLSVKHLSQEKLSC